MKRQAMIEVTRTDNGDPMRFLVKVSDAAGTTTHDVTMWVEECRRLGPGRPAIEVIDAAFRFLLDREPKESILRSFDVSVIRSYFPEFDQEMPTYL